MKRMLIRIPLALRAVRDLGPRQAFWYSVYQAGLRSGLYRRMTPVGAYPALNMKIRSPFHLPDRQQMADLLGDRAGDLIQEADEITRGSVRLFGGPPAPLQLVPPDASRHWSFYEGRPETWGVEDIKFLWEPARFGWVYPLGRAYRLTGDEKYPSAFWQYFETFVHGNAPNQGPNWASAQEVALRLLALMFAIRAFEQSPHTTPSRLSWLAGVIATHARRIPATLSYARAQHNNHHISEAVGLIAAGWVLPEHPEAARWCALGWRELNASLAGQIHKNGVYAQHSMNYHRLMLQLALQARLLGRAFPLGVQRRLSAAAAWLLAQVDFYSGHTPNLGSNDGAHILPLASGGFCDYRPTAQAAARAFLGRPAFPPGPWDETCLWTGLPVGEDTASQPMPKSPGVHRLGDPQSWATLRAARFRERPSHADQLHVELWWRGTNIARDAGTYRYTAADPWDNSLAQTFVHNTIEINGQNQMQRAGRFLWLDWAQASLLPTRQLGANAIVGQHNGYAHLGVVHRRILKQTEENHWQVIDHLFRVRTLRLDVPANPVYSYKLHWLLPDWPWKLDYMTLTLDHPEGGQVRLSVRPDLPRSPDSLVENIALVRAGEVLSGPAKQSPILGWFSPTYNLKIPALSLVIAFRSPLPVTLLSDWLLSE